MTEQQQIDDPSTAFKKRVEKTLDSIAKMIASPEYADFKNQIAELLANIQGKQFIFDLEGTLVLDLVDFSDSSSTYFAIPWMKPILETLLKNGNEILFWTSAPAKTLQRIQNGMGAEFASIPSISRDHWHIVVQAYIDRYYSKIDDAAVITILQKIWPHANEQTFRTGLSLFDDDLIDMLTDDPDDLQHFLKVSKLPQLFIDPQTGFFIDDNDSFIQSAVRRNWPSEHAIQVPYSPGKADVLQLAETLKLRCE